MELQEQIEIITNNFDYSKVRKTMIALNWNWQFNDGRGIPDEKTLLDKSKELLTECYNNGGGSVASGGFYAFNDNGELSLSFILTDYSASDGG